MDIKERLKTHISTNGKSQNQIAKSIGVSGGAISAWLSSTYKGDNQRLSNSINAYLRREEGRGKSLHIPTVEIETYRQIHFAMDIASEEIDITLICGHAGTGKTTALIDYVNQFGGIYIKADKSTTQHRLITMLADRLGIPGKGSAALLTESIIRTLEDLDTLVVIDEADYLTDGALEYLRQVVFDAGKTGLVLCGLPRLSASIANIRNDHEQLLSRIGVCLYLDDVSTGDMEKIIDQTWPGLIKQVKQALIKASSIRWRSDPSPCLRTLGKILKRMHTHLQRMGKETPETEDVKNAASLVMRRN